MPRARRAEPRALPLHAAPLPPRLDVSPAAPRLCRRRSRLGEIGAAGSGGDPAWICPGAEVFPDPWGAGEGGGGPARAGAMLNMWKVRELVDKA